MTLHWCRTTPMAHIDIDIIAIWINMPTTTERAACVNSNEISSDVLPSSLIQLHLAVLEKLRKLSIQLNNCRISPFAEPRIVLVPPHASRVQVQGVEV